MLQTVHVTAGNPTPMQQLERLRNKLNHPAYGRQDVRDQLMQQIADLEVEICWASHEGMPSITNQASPSDILAFDRALI